MISSSIRSCFATLAVTGCHWIGRRLFLKALAMYMAGAFFLDRICCGHAAGVIDSSIRTPNGKSKVGRLWKVWKFKVGRLCTTTLHSDFAECHQFLRSANCYIESLLHCFIARLFYFQIGPSTNFQITQLLYWIIGTLFHYYIVLLSNRPISKFSDHTIATLNHWYIISLLHCSTFKSVHQRIFKSSWKVQSRETLHSNFAQRHCTTTSQSAIHFSDQPIVTLNNWYIVSLLHCFLPTFNRQYTVFETHFNKIFCL